MTYEDQPATDDPLGDEGVLPPEHPAGADDPVSAGEALSTTGPATGGLADRGGAQEPPTDADSTPDSSS